MRGDGEKQNKTVAHIPAATKNPKYVCAPEEEREKKEEEKSTKAVNQDDVCTLETKFVFISKPI